jgi:hypothetical protein
VKEGAQEFTALNNCIDDITAHLAKCHLSKERISEGDLQQRANIPNMQEKQKHT